MSQSIAQSPVSVSYETSHSFTDEQLKIIKNSVAKGVSDDELDYFLEVCRSTGLNPLHRQIYAIMRKTDNNSIMTIQTAIDGYRLLAHRSSRHAGTDDAVYDREDAEHPNKATVTVYKMVRGVRCPFTATARWTEYCQTYNNKPSNMWQKFPYLMLAKCAEALALRKAFPAETSGIYTEDEMMQADEPPAREIPMKQGYASVHALPEAAQAKVSVTLSPERIDSIEANAWEQLQKRAEGLGFDEEQFAQARRAYKTVAAVAARLDKVQAERTPSPTKEADPDEMAAWEQLHIRASQVMSVAGWDAVVAKASGNITAALDLVKNAETTDLRKTAPTTAKGRH